MVGGGLMQLVAYGAKGNYLMAGGAAEAYPYNVRDSVMHWFVDRDDGMVTPADVEQWLLDGLILPPGTFPFSVGKERAAVRIQAAWRRAIQDPRYVTCRRRLRREFDALVPTPLERHPPLSVTPP